MGNTDHDKIIMNETTVNHLVSAVDRIELKLDSSIIKCGDCRKEIIAMVDTKTKDKISYKVFALIMSAVTGTVGALAFVIKYF